MAACLKPLPALDASTDARAQDLLQAEASVDACCFDAGVAAHPTDCGQGAEDAPARRSCREADACLPMALVTGPDCGTFWMERQEVTVERWERYLREVDAGEPRRDDPSCNWGDGGRGTHPANCVSWDEARGFCRWDLGTGASLTGDLPTWGQWNCAARGPEQRTWPWGEAAPEGRVCAVDTTCPVGSFPAGATPDHCIQHLAGNVGEWGREETDAGGFYVYGSAFDEPPRDLTDARNNMIPFHRATTLRTVGFRCVAAARQ